VADDMAAFLLKTAYRGKLAAFGWTKLRNALQ
jgi:hypothetical protein